MKPKRKISIERQKQLKMPSGKEGAELGEHLAYHNQGVNRTSIELLKIQGDDVVLEIGCGPGWAIEKMSQLAKHGGVYGIDPSDEMVKMARVRNQKAIIKSEVKIEKANANKLPHSNDFFSKALCVHVVYFWDHLEPELSEIYRVLQKGGKLLLYLSEAKRFQEKMEKSDVFHFYTPDQVITAAKNVGFSHIKTKHRKSNKKIIGFHILFEK